MDINTYFENGIETSGQELNLSSHIWSQKICRNQQSEGEIDVTFSVDVRRVKKRRNWSPYAKVMTI